MKLLINTSNLYVGGGVQVALSFINELKEINSKYEFYILLSSEINKHIHQSEYSSNFNFYLINQSPASLKTRKTVVSKLFKLEKQIKPDIVFTVFGPSYWRPKSIHLLGFADGWVYNPSSFAYQKLNFFKQLKMRLLVRYKSYYLKKDADFYVLETNDAKKKLSKTIHINKKNIHVIGNTYSSFFNKKELLSKENEYYINLPKKEHDEFRLVYIAHNHANKNIQIINDLIIYLKGYNITFVLTLDKLSFERIFSKSNINIINLGPINQKSCPSIYAQCDALFAPTLLETFSAAYPEAMKMGKPILTSSYSFAKDICQDAGVYFNPLDPKDISEKIKQVANDEKLRKELIKKGKKRIELFETAKTRAKKYVNLCESLVNKEKGEK